MTPIIEFKRANHYSTTPKALKHNGKVSRLKTRSKSVNLNPPLKDCLGVYDKQTGELRLLK